jgi:hypothetical protein
MATKKISQLTLATGVTGADLVPIVQGGVTKRALVSSLGGIGATGPTGVGVTGPAGSSITGPTGPAGAGEAYVTGTAPAAASEGATWFDTDDGKYYTRYSGLWVEVGGKHYP